MAVEPVRVVDGIPVFVVERALDRERVLKALGDKPGVVYTRYEVDRLDSIDPSVREQVVELVFAVKKLMPDAQLLNCG